jgi:hypothetical protein
VYAWDACCNPFVGLPSRWSARTPQTLNVEIRWKGHELIVRDIVDRFRLKTESYLEFDVEFGHSSVALPCFFDRAVGADTLEGDIHSFRTDHYDEIKSDLKRIDNIQVVKMDYREWKQRDENRYDMIHADIVHAYNDTFVGPLQAY